MGCRRATLLALVALVVSLCALAALYRLCASRESKVVAEQDAGTRAEQKAATRAEVQEQCWTTERDEEPLGAQFTHALPRYTHLGLLVSAGKEPIALHGRPTRRGSDKWNYFAVSNNYAPHKLPVFVNGRDAARLLGCTELSDGDTVDVRGYGTASVSLYTLEDAEHQFRVC